MAQIIQEEQGDKVFPREPCDKNLILQSIKKHQPDGVMMGVEKVIDAKKNNFGKVTIPVIFTITGEMPKCILYELDDDGQYVEYEDEITGEKKRKLKIDDGQLATVFFPFYANIKQGEDGLDENTTLIITPDFAELKECLDGFVFLGKYEVIKGKNRSFPSLLVERVEEEI